MSGGFFLAIEGSEGAGKSTLVRGVAAEFERNGVRPIVVREPGGTPVAERIRALLLDSTEPIGPASELFLFLAARAELVERVIRPALAAGRTVLADRFHLSTEAYQAAGRGLDLAFVRLANRVATGETLPHLTLVLDLPPEVGLERLRRQGQRLDRIEREDAAFHARVGAFFSAARGPDILHLDGTKTPEQVLRAAWQAIVTRLPPAGGAGPHQAPRGDGEGA
jgi:dTMP kinase